MIVSANETENFVQKINSVSSKDAFACRIISLYNSYSPNLAFVDYWLVLNDSNQTTGAIARSGTNFILFLTDSSCVDEVSAFMRVAGASTVLCSDSFKLDLFGAKSTTGAVLVRNDFYDEISSDLVFREPDIKLAFDLIVSCADDNFSPPPFDDFYVDVNHKLRHKTMRMFGLFDKDELVSVAMTVAESPQGAVLGAVSCSPNYRRLGYGSEIVKYICNSLISEGKSVFLHRAENANFAFYENLGFCETDKWREYSFER